MNILGIGPKVALGGLLSAITVIITGLYKNFNYSFIPKPAIFITGTILMAIGLYFWLDSVKLISTKFKSGILIKEGVYRIVRNPMYAAFILFIVPGLSLLFNNILLLLSSVIMLIIFKIYIPREEEYLLKEFGDSYKKYLSEVKQIIPFIW